LASAEHIGALASHDHDQDVVHKLLMIDGQPGWNNG